MYKQNHLFPILLLLVALTTAVVACTPTPSEDPTAATSTPTSRLGLDELLGQTTAVSPTSTATAPPSPSPSATASGKAPKPDVGDPQLLVTPATRTPVESNPPNTDAQSNATDAPSSGNESDEPDMLKATIPASEAGWWIFTNGNIVRDMAYAPQTETLYTATGGGLVAWHTATAEARKFISYDGLVNNDLLAIDVCPDGRVVAGTEKGVALYDPANETWEAWTSDNSNLKENTVTAVLCNENGLFLGYDVRGAHQIDLASNSWQDLGDTNTGLYSNAVDAIAQAPNGDLWLSAGFGLSRIAAADGTVTTWDEETGLPDDSITNMAVAPDGTLWLGAIDGALHYTAEGEWNLFNEDNVANMPLGLVRDVIPTADGRVWLGTSLAYLCLLDPANNRCEVVIQEADDTSLSSLVLADGILYQGTDRGVFRWQDGAQLPPFILNNQIPTNEFTSFVSDENGYVWAGTDAGLIRAAPADVGGREWRFFDRDNSGLPSNFVNDIVADPAQGGLWIGTYGGASYFDGQSWFTLDEDDGLPDDIVRVLAADAGGQIWFGTDDGLGVWDGDRLRWLTTNDGLPDNRVQALLYDAEREVLWVGTAAGLVALDPETTSPTAVFTVDNGALERDGITALALTPTGDLLLANDRHLLQRDAQGTVTQIGGFDSYYLTSIAIDPTNGDIWVGTTSDYLFLFDGSDTEQLTADTVPSHQIQDILFDALGTVWLAGNSYNEGGGGLGRFIPTASTSEE